MSIIFHKIPSNFIKLLELIEKYNGKSIFCYKNFYSNYYKQFSVNI